MINDPRIPDHNPPLLVAVDVPGPRAELGVCVTPTPRGRVVVLTDPTSVLAQIIRELDREATLRRMRTPLPEELLTPSIKPINRHERRVQAAQRRRAR